MTAQELERVTARRLEALNHELAGRVAPDRVSAVGQRHFERLRRHARITDYIPLLVYRCTKDELLIGLEADLRQAA
jgi:hypothetical protein